MWFWTGLGKLLLLCFGFEAVSSSLFSCSNDPLELTFLFDLTPSDTAVFELQKERVRDVIRHLETSAPTRSKTFSLIAFHRRPVSFLELADRASEETNRFLGELASLQSSSQFRNETSVARALEAAAKQYARDGKPGAQRLAFLVHDGVNTDLVSDTLEAVKEIREMNVTIFALSAGARPNGFALEGYTGKRSRVYSHDRDASNFEEALDLAIAACPLQYPQSLIEHILQTRRFATRAMDAPRKRMRKFAPEQECSGDKVDIQIVLDTSGSVHAAFDEERAFALDLIKRFDKKAFEKRIQVSVIRFSSDAQIVVPFSIGQSKAEILKSIQSIPFTGDLTKIATAVELGIENLERHQRNRAQQLFILISDGHGQEFWNVVQETGKKLQQAEWEVFSVTASRDYNLEELKLYAGEDARVFIGPKSASFLSIVGNFIDRCIAKDQVEGSGEVEALTTEETLTVEANCDLDVVLVVDRSQSVESDYQKELKTAQDVVALASNSAFNEGKVRVGVTSFANEGQVELGLSKNTRENVTETIGEIFHTGGTTSAVRGVNQALKFLIPNRRKTAKLLFLLISDGHSQDFWRDLVATSEEVLSLPNSLFLAATNSEHYSLSELATWTSDVKNVYHSRQIPHFLERIRDEMRKCGASSRKADQLIAKVSSLKEKVKPKDIIEVEGSGEGSGEEVEGSGQGKDIITADDVIESSTNVTEDAPLSDDGHKEKTRGIDGNLSDKETKTLTKSSFDGKGPCKVDLMFVIDISTSVEEEFEAQRQFTIDLVKRLPKEDFESRIHVGVITFNHWTKVVQPMDKLSSRHVQAYCNLGQSILSLLSNITNEGGATAVAQGMSLAAQEVQRTRRSDARQMIVLVSDGNSKDLWRDVISTSRQVKALAADVYAITVHRNYLFSELEMYATNIGYVYVNGRIEQFLDQTERALRRCVGPNLQKQ
ncbi:unnamed protein product, partial [Mesorhabditis belari]|uniref:VWFA domain-containing protein n=1 Tax=Mesorhabditis belari TaxID=2138241 RepID=A0AAF3J6X6_9BILA